jgi:hypothetical protein
MSRRDTARLTPEEKEAIRELARRGYEPRQIKNQVPRATPRQIHYYMASASIFSRSHIKNEARARGVKI